MVTLLKIIVRFAIDLQVAFASAFMSHGVSPGSSSRAVQAPEASTAAVTSSSFAATTTRSSASTTSLQISVATPTKPDAKKKQKREIGKGNNTDKDRAKEKQWLVRLYNGPMNKHEFVVRCLMEICGLDDTIAYDCMMQAHLNGRSAIGKYGKEVAELYKVTLTDEGLTTDMVECKDN